MEKRDGKKCFHAFDTPSRFMLGFFIFMHSFIVFHGEAQSMEVPFIGKVEEKIHTSSYSVLASHRHDSTSFTQGMEQVKN
jgi:hypothetical protein